MFSYQTSNTFNDFYNSMQSSFESKEGFGKNVKQKNKLSAFNNDSSKFSSIETFSGLSLNDNSTSKSLSTNEMPTKKSFAKLRKASENSNSSTNSMGSINSVSTTNTIQDANSPKEAAKKKCSKKKKTSQISYKKKFKTEPCKFWVNQGFCEFGDQCAFAHGTQELKEKIHVSSNYKTKKCVSFHENGFCPYGARCQFIHCAGKDCHNNESEVKGYELEIETAEIWFAENPDCMCMKKSRRRLPYFEMLSNVITVNNEDN